MYRSVAASVAKQKVESVHFGAGPQRKKLEALIEESQPESPSVQLVDLTPNHEMMIYYETNTVDLFANLSATGQGCPSV